jgi:predicted DCC family thiol-disulfide oxidoreductase YuxK
MLQTANESGPQLLASAEPVAVEEPTKTLVIEYTDIVLASNVVVEEVNRVEEGKVSIRLRNLRSRVSNTIRDYAYQAYAETRGELLALADR